MLHQRAPLLVVPASGQSRIPRVVLREERLVAGIDDEDAHGGAVEAIYTRAVTALASSSGSRSLLLAWTHVLYPLFAALLARVVPRKVRKGEIEPAVTVIITAYNEEPVIARRIENLLELDYPRDKLRLVVTSDASSDRTEEIALQYPEVSVISNPRGGKVAAQDAAVRQSDSEIVAFSDANATWSADALRKLVHAFEDPEVAYVCGRLNILDAEGSNKEGRLLALRDGAARRRVDPRLG